MSVFMSQIEQIVSYFSVGDLIILFKIHTPSSISSFSQVDQDRRERNSLNHNFLRKQYIKYNLPKNFVLKFCYRLIFLQKYKGIFSELELKKPILEELHMKVIAIAGTYPTIQFDWEYHIPNLRFTNWPDQNECFQFFIIYILTNKMSSKKQNQKEETPGLHLLPDGFCYEADLVPPNIPLLQIHNYANLIRTGDNDGKCPCCQVPIRKELIPIGSDLLQTPEVAKDIAVYFYILKASIYLLLGLFGISGIYNLITNFINNDCSTNIECSPTFLNQISWINKYNQATQLKISLILGFIGAIGFWAGTYYLKTLLDRRFRIDKSKLTARNYTLLYSGISCNMFDFENFLCSDPANIAMKFQGGRGGVTQNITPVIMRTIRIPNKIREIVDLENERTQLTTRISKAKPEQKPKLQTKLQQVDQQLVELKDPTKQLYTGHALITFRDYIPTIDSELGSVLNSGAFCLLKTMTPQSNYLKCSLQTEPIFYRLPPEPSDMRWEAFTKIGNKSALFGCLKFIIIVLLLFLGIEAIIFLGNAAENGLTSQTPLYNFIIGQVVSIINTILGLEYLDCSKGLFSFFQKCSAVNKTCQQYMQRSQNNANYSHRGSGRNQQYSPSPPQEIIPQAPHLNISKSEIIGERIIFLGLLTFPIGTIGVLLTSLLGTNFFGAKGAANKVFFILLSDILTQVVLGFLDIGYLNTLRKRKGIIKEGDKSKLTQKEACELFKNPEFSIAEQYTNFLRIMFVTMLFGYLFPIALPIAIIGLIIIYYTNKYLLLRRCSPSQEDSYGVVHQNIIYFILFLPLVFIIGILITSNVDPKVYLYILGGAGGIEMIYFCYSYSRIIANAQKITQPQKPLTFTENRLNFKDDYDLYFPLTKEKARERWDQGNKTFISEMDDDGVSEEKSERSVQHSETRGRFKTEWTEVSLVTHENEEALGKSQDFAAWKIEQMRNSNSILNKVGRVVEGVVNIDCGGCT